MTEADAFLAAICEHPDEDTPRLVFADYLEEHDEPERAEFIRVQIALSHGAKVACNRTESKRHLLCRKSDCDWCRLRRREKELLDYSAAPDETPETACHCWGEGVYKIVQEYTFRRGFVAEITLPCADWLQHRDALLRVAPLEMVTLTHLPHFSPQDTYTLRRGQSLYLNNEVGDVMDLSFPASRLTAPSH